MGHGIDENVLVGGVGAVADGAEAIEGGNAECGGEVSVGTTADGGFPESEAQLFGQRFGAGEEGGAVFALQGRASEAARDFELCAAMNGLKGVQAGFEGAHVRGAPGAKVESSFGAIGNDVGASAAFDDVGIDGDAAAGAVPFFDTGDLCGEFVDGVDAFFRGEAGVRGAAVDKQLGFANSFAGGFKQAAWAEGRFEDEDSVAATGFRLDNRARGLAADFFVGGPEKDEVFSGRKLQLFKQFKSEQRLDDAGFHVKGTRAEGFAARDAEGHFGESAGGIDGIVMAENQKLAAKAGGGWRPSNAKMVAMKFFFQDVNDAAA